jgi:Leucine Rich repeat
VLRRSCLVALLLAGPGCKDELPTPPPAEAVADSAVPLPRMVSDDPTHVVVHHADQLEQVDLAQVRVLELAMSPADQVGFLDEIDPETACTRLDLVKLATKTPALRRLRISGCQGAVHAGLGAFGERVSALELADLVLDGVTIGNLVGLTGLHTLTLSRMDAGPDSLLPLRALPLRHLVLRDLQDDSDVALMLDLWPRTLTQVELSGQWAGHKAMLTLAKAQALQILELRDTRVGNFSLNQIKPLLQLRDVTFEGSTFNDSSPLYFRDLPVERFVCTCRRLGDVGLRQLRHTKTIRRLELRETAVTGPGLEILGELALLESLVLLDRDIGEDGLRHLAALSKLELLELSGPIEDPSMKGLGGLVGLRTLRLSHPQIDDRIAPQLEKLTRLRWLDLGGTAITDEGLVGLAALTELQTLHLHHTRVTNRGLAHLAKLTALEELTLHSTDVVDEGVTHLVDLQRLHTLRLDRTLITDAAIDTLVQLQALRRLNLAYTVLTATGVDRLRELPALEVLELEGIRG